MVLAKSPIRFRESSIIESLTIFLLWWAVAALVFARIESNFLRAESGWYLLLSKSPAALHQVYLRNFATKTYSGHYTPIAFIAEFETAKLVGTTPAFWKWRQITLAALLATILFSLVRKSCHFSSLSPGKSIAAAAALTALLIFQPSMTEFIAWPFMIMQLLWLVLTSFALLSLMKIVERPTEARWRWLAVIAAYGSLHVLGLGLITVAATAAVFVDLLVCEHRNHGSKKLAVPLGVLVVLGALHALLILFLPHAETMPVNERFPHFVSGIFGLIPGFALAALRALFSSQPARVDGLQLWPDWPYGLAFVAIMIATAIAVFFSNLRNRQPTSRQRATFVLATFAAISFIALVGLISARELTHPSLTGFSDYFIGSRYLIPAQFALLGFLILVFIRINAVPFAVSLLLNFFLLFSAIAGNAQFRKNVYPKVQPRSAVSHARAWQSIVSMASQCQKAGLPIPNVPLGVLIQEFPWDLKRFEPLLLSDLKLPADVKLEFTPWEEVSDHPTEQYLRNVPALLEVKHNLTPP